MKTIFIDYESYYSNEYSLRKMTPVEYVLDHRFECIGAAIKEGVDGESYWVDGDDLPLFFKDNKPEHTALVSHNALFDACITAWRYNYVPKLTIDTLGIARATMGHKLKSLSLANVALALGIGAKGDTIHKVIGMNAAAIKAAGLYDSYIQYALNDADLCAEIYRKLVLSKVFPINELVVMDMVLRCAIQPQFLLDPNVLALHHHTIKTSKEQLLARVGVAKEELMSNDKFAAALRNLGVEPPMKTSLTTGKEAYAFARTDPDFIALEEHDNPEVQTLVAARLGHKSTLEETRTERLTSISRLQWPGTLQGKMPIPLRYSGAHTHRLSGDWSLNMQNLPRGGALRRAVIAPPGHQVVAADASQIEARMAAWICGQLDLVQQFANKEDVYSTFASRIFERPITKADKTERFLGKTCILGMQYGVGWEKFQKTVKLQSKAQSGQTIDLSDADAMRIVNLYRTTYAAIPATWKLLNNGIATLAGNGGSFSIGPCVFSAGEISLPSGLKLKYHKLRHEDGGWVYEYGGKIKRLYGGALLENIVQALARIVVMDTATRLRPKLARLGIQLALQVHDELVYVVPDDLTHIVKKVLLDEMRVPPAWAPTLPLDAEADCGPSYGDAH
jgi:DNA polymerase